MPPPFRNLQRPLDLQSAYAELARHGLAGERLDDTLRGLTASTARTLNIERVGLWALTAQHTRLECVDLYELSPDRHSDGIRLQAEDYPQYFRALGAGDPIVADDAMKHPASHELTDDYLLHNGISALINSPIHAAGEVQGVLSIERVGPHSAWTSIERLFAHAMAGLVSIALLHDQLSVNREALRDAELLRSALFNGVRDAILISDAGTGEIIEANEQAERLFGRRVENLLGALQSELWASVSARDIRELCIGLARSDGAQALRGEVLCRDRLPIPVEISNRVIDLGKGRRFVQGVFRELAAAVDETISD